MSADDQQTPTTEAADEAVSYEPGSTDEAVAAFAKSEAAIEGDDAREDEPDPADEPEAEADPEADEADPEDADAGDELVEVEAEDGKTYKVPPVVQKQMLRQADYSRKMNEVGAKGKALDERLAIAETLAEGAEKRAEALAAVRSLDERIKQFDGIDWQKAREEDPGRAAMAAVELMALRDQRKEAAQTAANVAREMTAARNESLDSARAEMDATLRKSLKGWGDEMGTRITQYAVSAGVDIKTLQRLTDPGLVIALEKAMRLDALRQQKTELKAKAATAPRVVKPGAPRKTDPRADAMKRLRTENTQEAAEAAFLSRL